MTMTRAILIVVTVGALAIGVAQCAERTGQSAAKKREPACFVRMPDGHGVPIYDADGCGPNTWTPKGK